MVRAVWRPDRKKRTQKVLQMLSQHEHGRVLSLRTHTSIYICFQRKAPRARHRAKGGVVIISI